jgi:hypothetical protein
LVKLVTIAGTTETTKGGRHRPADAFARHVAVGDVPQPALLAAALTLPGVGLNGPLA